MSLALRFGASFPPALLSGGIQIGLPQLHRLPTLADFLPVSWTQQTIRSKDSRLEELKQLLEKNGQPPFMIDNGTILKAVPKKKPSYKRTREKLYSPGDKQIQPLQNLRRCAACGRVKRSHFMCMHCFAEIRAFLKEKKKAVFGEPQRFKQDLDAIDEKIIYPGKYKSEFESQMEKKDWIPKREEPLMYHPSQVKKD